MAEQKNGKKQVLVAEGQYVLRISKDRMEAYLEPADPGTEIHVDESLLVKEIKLNGIVSGLLPKMIPQENGILLVAKGKPAVNGENAKILTHIKPTVVRTPKTKTDAKDTVDFRELGNIVNVDEGTLLLEKVLPTQGIPGTDVLGAEIKAKAGKDITLKIGEGVEPDETGLKFYSKRNGKFLIADGKPVVLQSHTIRGDIDMSVGNIHFNGNNLSIEGEVKPGFQLECQGSITVYKGVHNSRLNAGGKITIKGGVIGEETYLLAKDDITADFVENGVKIETEGNIIIEDFAVQGNFRCGINMTAMKRKGAIIGGKHVVGGSLFVKSLGSDAEVTTEISVGLNPSLEARKEKLEQEKLIWPEKLTEVIKNVGALNQLKKQLGGKLPPDKQQLLQKLNDLMPKIMEQVTILEETEKILQEEMAKLKNEVIFVYGTVYPGVTVKIGKAVRKLSSVDNMVAIFFDQSAQQIHIRPLTSDERSASRD